MTASLEIERLIRDYADSHSDFCFPPSGNSHPSVLAMMSNQTGIKPWLFDQLGGPAGYWEVMLAAAKEWFPHGGESIEYRMFCTRLNSEAALFWDGIGPEFRERYLEIYRDFQAWKIRNRGIVRSQAIISSDLQHIEKARFAWPLLDRATPHFDLQRFVTAQQDTYENALAELQRWRKESHWMWFMFPQIDGLGGSTTSKRYAIKGRSEAEAYLEHPTLGPRLLSCCRAVLATHGLSASDIFGHPDDVKLKSSMTLFACISAPESVFSKVLNKFFAGQMDQKTVELLKLHP
jgi:uncharacterized protein (DUF1810 family)